MEKDDKDRTVELRAGNFVPTTPDDVAEEEAIQEREDKDIQAVQELVDVISVIPEDVIKQYVTHYNERFLVSLKTVQQWLKNQELPERLKIPPWEKKLTTEEDAYDFDQQDDGCEWVATCRYCGNCGETEGHVHHKAGCPLLVFRESQKDKT